LSSNTGTLGGPRERARHYRIRAEYLRLLMQTEPATPLKMPLVDLVRRCEELAERLDPEEFPRKRGSGFHRSKRAAVAIRPVRPLPDRFRRPRRQPATAMRRCRCPGSIRRSRKNAGACFHQHNPGPIFACLPEHAARRRGSARRCVSRAGAGSVAISVASLAW